MLVDRFLGAGGNLVRLVLVLHSMFVRGMFDVRSVDKISWYEGF